MSHTVDWIFWSFFLLAAVCACIMTICREVMISELKDRPEFENSFKYPRLSWNFSEVWRLHRQLYPESRVSKITLTSRVFFICFGGAAFALVLLYVLLR
jgi:hypothetical protein